MTSSGGPAEFPTAQGRPHPPFLSELTLCLGALTMERGVEVMHVTRTYSTDLSWHPHLVLFSWMTKWRWLWMEAPSDERTPNQLGFLNKCIEQRNPANSKPLSTFRWARNTFKVLMVHISQWLIIVIIIHNLESNCCGVVVTEGRVHCIVRWQKWFRIKLNENRLHFQEFQQCKDRDWRGGRVKEGRYTSKLSLLLRS